MNRRKDVITRKDVAIKAGVSVATVSNVFSGKDIVSPRSVERVLQAAKELRYVPNSTARSLSLGRSNHIGIAINEAINPFHMEIVKYVEDYAIKNGFLVTIFDISDSLKGKISFIEKFSLDALINFTTVQFYDEFCEILQSKNTVLVNFGLYKCTSFGRRDEDAMIAFMEKLRELGHTRVGFVSTIDESVLRRDERGKTFFANREKMGFAANDSYIVCAKGSAFDSLRFGYTGAKELLSRCPEITALFALNDLAAIGTIRAAKELGYDCPRDISVIGFDNIALTESYIPSVSTVGFDKKEYGQNMAKKTIECILEKSTGKGYDFKVKSVPYFRESIGVAKYR